MILPFDSSCMKPFTWLLFLVLFISGCGRSGETSWQDGPFKVYALDLDFDATCLGFDNHPGFLGLVDAEVVAAGSNNQCVVVEQLERATGRTQFFIVPKERGEFHSGKVDGPMTRDEYARALRERNLPAFSWRKKK